MGYPKFKELKFTYEYDFAIDGGATGDINLRLTSGINAMEAGLVITDLDVLVVTALDDAGDTATVTVGNEDDTDGYMADIMTLAETVNTVIGVGTVAGALVWDDTNDHRIPYRIPDAGASVPSITVATEALTAGKAIFNFICIRLD